MPARSSPGNITSSNVAVKTLRFSRARQDSVGEQPCVCGVYSPRSLSTSSTTSFTSRITVSCVMSGLRP